MAQVQPYVRDGEVDLVSIKEFYDLLEVRFGDPNREETTQWKLSTLCEANKDFGTYF
jgi:hypothetical protein